MSSNHHTPVASGAAANAVTLNVPLGELDQVIDDIITGTQVITQDADDLTYTPAVLTDWNGDTDPGNIDDALDQLAQRVDDIETAVEYLTFTVDNGSSVIATGVAGHLVVPFACTITEAWVLARQSGSIVVDIWKDIYGNFPPDNADSITASAPPTLSSAQASKDTTLTGWTTSLSTEDILAFNVDSVTTITRVEVILKVTRTQ